MIGNIQYSHMNYGIPTKNQILRHTCLLALVLVIIVGILPPLTIADYNQTISINPIGDYHPGVPIQITGTSTILKCTKIGIEVFPKTYWDSVSEYAKGDTSGKVVFNLIASSSVNFDPSGVNLVRFNADGTVSTRTMEIPQNHLLTTGPVEKTVLGLKHWSIPIEKNDNGTAFSPGTYHVNIWDATNQKPSYDNPMPNGWDIIHQKIYPSTGRINRFDTANEKDMYYAEFTIR